MVLVFVRKVILLNYLLMENTVVNSLLVMKIVLNVLGMEKKVVLLVKHLMNFKI